MKAKTLNRHLNAGRTRALAEHEEPLAAALGRIFVKAGDVAARNREMIGLAISGGSTSVCRLAIGGAAGRFFAIVVHP